MTDISTSSAPSSDICAASNNASESHISHDIPVDTHTRSEARAESKTDNQNEMEQSASEYPDKNAEPDASESPAEQRIRVGAERLLGSWLKQSEEASAPRL